jgi:amino-acid N-acetyltransferase
MQIETARPSDARAVEQLLADADLPVVGVTAAFEHGVVARDGDAVVGAAAVEVFGEAGLLRSVVVESSHRGTGVGLALVNGAEAVARAAGVRELYLLTETAAAWFPRLGYQPVDRETARAVVGQSIEFSLSCAETGVALRRRLA